jgi:hypothetical protein
VITAQAGQPIILSGASDGALVGRPHRIAGANIEVPKELQKWYDGVTSVTLPCGRVITPAKNTFLKYNACAFDGQTILAPNGRYIADQFWVGPAAQDYADIRTPGRFNIDLSLRRTFKIREHMTLNFNADATNLLNNAQYSGAYNGGLGNTNLVDNPAKGLKVGMGSNDAFGTIGLGTFDPRQVTMRLFAALLGGGEIHVEDQVLCGSGDRVGRDRYRDPRGQCELRSRLPVQGVHAGGLAQDRRRGMARGGRRDYRIRQRR